MSRDCEHGNLARKCPICELIAAEARIAELESKLEEALHGAEGKRWNMHRSGDGEIQVCFGDHERGTGCQYVTFVEKSRLHQLSEDHSHCEGLLHELGERASRAESRLDSARRYCEEVIAREPEHLDVWRRACASVAANVLNELNGTVKHPVVERPVSISGVQSADAKENNT